MLTNTGTAFEILDFLDDSAFKASEEQEIISKAYFAIFTEKGSVTNKDLILCLLNLLEQESSVVKQDVYRNTLEIIVGRTSDDL